jgi:hypothetical protein
MRNPRQLLLVTGSRYWRSCGPKRRETHRNDYTKRFHIRTSRLDVRLVASLDE